MTGLSRFWMARAGLWPTSSLAQLTSGAPILVLTPHPDDESLGCGGLIASCAAAGIGVEVALLTDGAGSHPGSRRYPPARLAALRAGELARALGALGLAPGHLHLLGYPDAAAPSQGREFDRACDLLCRLIVDSGARTLFASWAGDPHCDHAAAARIADAAAARTGARHLAYPVWGRLRPGAAAAGPATRLDVRAFLAAKRRAVACHRSQLGGLIRDTPHGFRLPRALLDACLTGTEIFFEQRAAA